MAGRKPGILRNLRIKHVALVDMGANLDHKTGDGAHIMLHKSASDAGSPAAARDRIDPPIQPATDRLAVVKAVIAAITNKEQPAMSRNLIAKLLGLASEPDAEKRAAAVSDVLKEFPPDDAKPVHKADDPMCKCDACMSKRASADSEAAIQKRIDDTVAAAVEKATKDSNARLTAEIEKRETGEVRAELRKYAHVPFDLDKDVPIYLAMKRNQPEQYAAIIAKFDALDKQLALSAAYTDIGVRKGTGEGSAWAQIEAKAEQLMEKSANTEMTREQAIEKVMERNPALVKQYRQESQ